MKMYLAVVKPNGQLLLALHRTWDGTLDDAVTVYAALDAEAKEYSLDTLNNVAQMVVAYEATAW